MNCKIFFASVYKKEAKRFNLALRYISERSQKLRENIIRSWKNENLEMGLLKWFHIVQLLKKYHDFSSRFNNLLDHHKKNFSFVKLFIKSNFIKVKLKIIFRKFQT